MSGEDVKRYEFYRNGEVHEDEGGRYMKFADLAPLLQAAREQGWREGVESAIEWFGPTDGSIGNKGDFDEAADIAVEKLKEKHHA